MQSDHAGLLVRAAQFDGEVADQHVERRLARTIAVPAPDAIVADAADARGKRGEGRRAVSREERQDMLGDKRRSDGVESEGRCHGVTVQMAIAALRPGAVRQGQCAGRHDDAIGRIAGPRLDGGCDARLVGQIEDEGRNALMLRHIAAARSGKDLAPLLHQRTHQRRADTAARSENCGPLPVHRMPFLQAQVRSRPRPCIV